MILDITLLSHTALSSLTKTIFVHFAYFSEKRSLIVLQNVPLFLRHVRFRLLKYRLFSLRNSLRHVFLWLLYAELFSPQGFLRHLSRSLVR